MKRIRTEKENKVTHRSESSQPILRHGERRSTSPLVYHSSSLLPTPPTVLSHHPLFYNPVTVGVSKAGRSAQRGAALHGEAPDPTPKRQHTAHTESCGLSLAEAPAPTCCLSEKRPLPPLFTLPPLSSNKQLRPRTGNSGKTLWNSLEKI